MKNVVALAVLFLFVVGLSEGRDLKEESWFVITHPTYDSVGTWTGQGTVQKHGNQYVITFAGKDSLKALFPAQPKLANSSGVPGSIRYEAYDPQRKLDFSVLHVMNRSAAGFQGGHDQVWDQLQKRFDRLADKGISVTPQPVTASNGTYCKNDRTTNYDLMETKDGKNDVLQVAERVINTSRGLIVIDVIGPDAHKSGASLLKGVSWAPEIIKCDIGRVAPPVMKNPDVK